MLRWSQWPATTSWGFTTHRKQCPICSQSLRLGIFRRVGWYMKSDTFMYHFYKKDDTLVWQKWPCLDFRWDTTITLVVGSHPSEHHGIQRGTILTTYLDLGPISPFFLLTERTCWWQGRWNVHARWRFGGLEGTSWCWRGGSEGRSWPVWPVCLLFIQPGQKHKHDTDYRLFDDGKEHPSNEIKEFAAHCFCAALL